MANPAAPGIFFCFAAMVLLIIVSVSAPTWNAVSFLNVVGPGGVPIHFGVFGYTGSKTHLGYAFPTPVFDAANVNTTALYNTTKALILHPIAAALAGLAMLFGLCAAGTGHRAGAVLMSLTALAAFLVTLAAFAIDLALFGIARSRLRRAGVPVLAQYGNANWMTLGALVALGLGSCFAFFGIFGRYRTHRREFRKN